MESKVPVPTDNIFKFYALFSLLVVIFCIGAALYVNKSTNQLMFAKLVELDTLEQETAPTPSQEFRIAALKRQLEIARSNRSFSIVALGILLGGCRLGHVLWLQEVAHGDPARD